MAPLRPHVCSLLLLCVLLVSGNNETEVVRCYTYYKHSAKEPGPKCPAQCPYRTNCQPCVEGECQSSCIYGEVPPPSVGQEDRTDDCRYLLKKGQLVIFNDYWIDENGSAISVPMCVSCSLSGCVDCEAGSDGQPKCKKCAVNFESDEKGGCKWKNSTFNALVYVFYSFLGCLVIWIIVELVIAELMPVINKKALERGLVMRRRAQLFRPFSSSSTGDDGDENVELKRYPLCTNLHGRKSGKIEGPGLTVFMNWFIYTGAIGLWFLLGTALYAPYKSEEAAYLDPCQQQDRIHTENWDFRRSNPTPGARNYVPWAWALWNYCGALGITIGFLLWQHDLWYHMVEDSRVPSLRQYCVQFTNMPPDVIDDQRIFDSVKQWMDGFGLDGSLIHDVSIAFDVPSAKHEEIEELIKEHIDSVANRYIERATEGDPPTLSSEPSTCSLAGEDGPAQSKCFLFWVQLVALILFQTPFKFCAQAEKVCPAGSECDDARKKRAKDLLTGLKGSGHVFVVMENEALARAVVGMGAARLKDLRHDGDPEVKVFVQKAAAEAPMIKWMEYSHVPIGWRIYRFVIIAIILFAALNVWLMLFAGFLHFEIATSGNTNPTKGMAGFFVGMLVPIGNALLGAIIDLCMNYWGFRDEDDLRLWRQILNVFINGAANVGEIYLIYKKVYNPVNWGLWDFAMHLRNKFEPIGVNPNTRLFQEEMLAILFPAGMLVPIFTIPLLSDFLPFFIGRLRLKGDLKLSPAEAERIMKPGAVDPIGPYTDFVINFFLVAFASWISPGWYLIVLWIAFVLWIFLLYINFRFNVLRWQARTYFGSMKTHVCESFLLAFPLGFLCAALEHQWHPVDRSGLVGMLLHIGFHFVFVAYVLDSIVPRKSAYGTSLTEMMKHEFAPIANYQNTNPIKVLRRIYASDLEYGKEELVYFRSDKWYLQKKPGVDQAEVFADEAKHIKVDRGVLSCVGTEVACIGSDIVQLGKDGACRATDASMAMFGIARDPSERGTGLSSDRPAEGTTVVHAAPPPRPHAGDMKVVPAAPRDESRQDSKTKLVKKIFAAPTE